MNDAFSHLDNEGSVRMVDVGSKEVTQREAVATATVVLEPATMALLRQNALPKGDVLVTARIAGLLAAKQTSALIPLTHPLQLNFVEVNFDTSDDRRLRITATVRCHGRTGVEIEAMTAASIAALTIYDMCKSVEKGITIEAIQLERKSGGKSGTFNRIDP